MPISFNNIPSNIKVPLYWVEVDPSMAGLPTLGLRALLIGTMLGPTFAKATQNVPIAIGSQAQADAAFGKGSELSRMFSAYFANNFANEVWGLGVPEPAGGTAATGTITVTTAPTAAGTIDLYIGGVHVPVNVGATDTTATIATNIAAAINATLDLSVSATAATNIVTLTNLWKGVNGNDITVLVNYYGTIGGEILPPGLVLTLPATGQLTGGAGVPVFTTPISNMGEMPFEYVAMPYTDSTSLQAFEQEYGFSDTGRWGWQRQLFGHIFNAKRDTYANLLTFGLSRNSPVMSIMAVEVLSPSPVFEWTAAYCAKAQRALANDPARPLQTLSLNMIKTAPLQSRFHFVELNSLADNGMAIQKAGSDQQPMIARETTTYQLNLYGNPDDAYELVTTLATLAKVLRNQRQAVTSKFARVKLANDGTRFGPGQAIVTPGVVKAELIAQYRLDMYNGLVEDVRDFTEFLIVERDPNDPNRLNVLYPPDLINQLRIFAVLAQFRLQYDRGVDQLIVAPSPIGVTGILPA
jgi:phage tail sheath gpL-like